MHLKIFEAHNNCWRPTLACNAGQTT